jgi:zinc protease
MKSFRKTAVWPGAAPSVAWLVVAVSLLWPLASGARALTLFSGDLEEHQGSGALLPSDPALVSGSLPNGFRYVIKPHAGAPGKLALRLVVGAGSLSEPDHARGAAALCARLIEAAADENPAGDALRALAERNTEIRVDRVVTDYETSSFTILAPANDATVIKTALWRLADIAQGASLSEARLTQLRPAALEDPQRCRLSERMTRLIVPWLMPGSRIADHLPCPGEEQICALNGPETIAFIASRYTPSNMTLFVIGDAEPRLVLSLINKFFGGLEGPPATALPSSWVSPPAGPRVFVASDPELTAFAVELTVVDLAAGPVTTEQDLRRRLVDSLATRALEQRLRALVDAGEAPFSNADSWTGDIPGPMRMTAATVTGDARLHKTIIERLCREVAHARYEGVSDRRLADARAEALAEAEEAARTEDAQDLLTTLDRIARLSQQRSALSNARQRLAIIDRLLPTISPEEVSDALSDRFDLERCAVVVLTPAGPSTPTAENLRPLIEESLASLPTESIPDDGPVSLLSRMPAPGEVEEISMHPASGVTSIWLQNGVRAHHRSMTTRPGVVVIALTIAGGRIEETEDERGLTQASAALWRNPAGASRSAGAVRRILLGQPVRLSASIGDDGIRLSATCAREHAETAMQLLHLLLTEPVIEGPAFQRWRRAMIAEIEGRNERSLGALKNALASALYQGDDPRRPPLEADEVRAVQRAAAQEWIERLTHEAPLEVAIVGDLPRSEALDLTARYFGSLAPRDRPSELTFCELRRLAVRPAPGAYFLSAPGAGDQAVALVGLRGSDPGDAGSRLLLDLAARSFGIRLSAVCSLREGLATSISVQHLPAEAYPGDGLLYALGTGDPEKIEQLAGAMNREVSDLIRLGPRPDELADAKSELLTELDQRMNDPSFWAWSLCDLTYHARSIDELLGRRATIEAATSDALIGVLSSHDVPRGPDGQRLTIVVRPNPGAQPLDNLVTSRPAGP